MKNLMINVGDYVRTKYGNIRKIIEITNKEYDDEPDYLVDKGMIDIVKKEETTYIENWLFKEQIIKSSPNLIDLIEVGDYVNGDRVKALKGDIESHKINNEEDVIYTEYINDYDEWCGYEEDEIKSIVTKEMYSSVEYRVENN